MSKPTSWKLLENASFLTCYTCTRAKDFWRKYKKYKNTTEWIFPGELARHQPSVRPATDLLFHLFCGAGKQNTPKCLCVCNFLVLPPNPTHFHTSCICIWNFFVFYGRHIFLVQPSSVLPVLAQIFLRWMRCALYLIKSLYWTYIKFQYFGTSYIQSHDHCFLKCQYFSCKC